MKGNWSYRQTQTPLPWSPPPPPSSKLDSLVIHALYCHYMETMDGYNHITEGKLVSLMVFGSMKNVCRSAWMVPGLLWECGTLEKALGPMEVTQTASCFLWTRCVVSPQVFPEPGCSSPAGNSWKHPPGCPAYIPAGQCWQETEAWCKQESCIISPSLHFLISACAQIVISLMALPMENCQKWCDGLPRLDIKQRTWCFPLPFSHRPLLLVSHQQGLKLPPLSLGQWCQGWWLGIRVLYCHPLIAGDVWEVVGRWGGCCLSHFPATPALSSVCLHAQVMYGRNCCFCLVFKIPYFLSSRRARRSILLL